MRPLYLLLFACLPLAAPANAYEIVLTLEGDIASGCHEVWFEEGLPLVATSPVPPECGGLCFFGPFLETGVFLAPGTLHVDLTTLSDLTRIEVDGESGGGGFYVAALLNAVPLVTVLDDYDTVMDVTGLELDELRVNSCEGAVHEIRIYGIGVPAWSGSWGCVKALYGVR